MKIFHCFLLFGLALSFVSVRAQTVDQVINKHIEALGGKAKLLSLNSLYEEITIESMGQSMNAKVWQVNNKLWRMETTIGGGGTITVVTPVKGWQRNPYDNSIRTLNDKEVKLFQTQLSTTDQLVDYAALGNKVELLKKDTACGKDCYPVRCTLPTGVVFTYFIDVKTGYILRQTTKGGNNGSSVNAKGEAVLDYSDYRPEGGFILPHVQRPGVPGGMSFTMRVTRFEVNKPVDVEGLSRQK